MSLKNQETGWLRSIFSSIYHDYWYANPLPGGSGGALSLHAIVHLSKQKRYVYFTFQLTVFRMLFQQWSDFCQFRESMTEDKIMPTIERHRKRAKIAEKKKQKEIEERKERVRVELQYTFSIIDKTTPRGPEILIFAGKISNKRGF